MPDEKEHQQNLAEAINADRQKQAATRPKKSLGKLAVDIAREAGISNPRVLIGFILLNDLFFFFAIMMALLKDISDFVGIGSIPVIGTAVTLITSITLICAMLICGTPLRSVRKNKKTGRDLALKTVQKWGTLAAGTMFELIFGLNFLPIETITAFVIYLFILKERKEAYEAQQEETRDDEMSPEYA